MKKILLLLFGLFSLAACRNKATTSYFEIGDFHTGGIIFYVDGKGGGLVAAPAYTERELNWEEAKSYCDSLVTNTEGEPYLGWYLPDLEELDLMWENLHMLGCGISFKYRPFPPCPTALGDFISSNYWSSDEYRLWRFRESPMAMTNNFSDGEWEERGKRDKYRVRAVRHVKDFTDY